MRIDKCKVGDRIYISLDSRGVPYHARTIYVSVPGTVVRATNIGIGVLVAWKEGEVYPAFARKASAFMALSNIQAMIGYSMGYVLNYYIEVILIDNIFTSTSPPVPLPPEASIPPTPVVSFDWDKYNTALPTKKRVIM